MSRPLPTDLPSPPSPWHSIDRRLPLLLTLLLVVAVAALAAGAYRAVSRTLLDSTEARVGVSAGQVVDLLARSASERLRLLRGSAGDPALARALLAREGDEARVAAGEVLAGLLEGQQTVAVELWSRGGSLVAEASAAAAREAPSGRDAPTKPGVGRFWTEHEDVLYDLVVPVPAGQAGSGGWLRVRRRLGSAPAADAITGLIGRDARLLVGNADGALWTDLSGPAAAPVEARVFGSSVTEVVWNGERRLGVAMPVPETPWQVWVDLPRSAALAPALQFLRRILGLSTVLVLVGAAVAWRLGRQMTRPLDQLTAAAEGLAAGDLEREVPLRRRDEVGRLARAFDRMRHEVADARLRLEHRVEERTSELRETLEQLHAAQDELVRKERLAILGQLASGVGHELRNPLAVMTNALYYLDMVLEGESAEVGEYLGILRHQVDLSEKIVSDLLDFARIKPPQRREIDLAVLAEEQLGRVAIENGLAVERHFPSDLPRAYGDPVQVGQVVVNLVTNAVQAMEGAAGTLRLAGRSAGEGAVELAVEDSGPGVPADQRERIFEPLFTTKARGIGLGLAVSRRLAEANHGTLCLGDGRGSGAAFLLRLPVAPAGAP